MSMDGQTYCPNFQTCRLVTTSEVVDDMEKKEEYINKYCHSYHEDWLACKRYITKEALQLCPDFVLPDTQMTVNDILDKWDEEIEKSLD